MEPNNPVAAATSPGMKRSRADDDHQYHSSHHHHHRNSGRGGGRGGRGRGRGGARQSHFLDRMHDGSQRPSRRRGRESGFHKPYPHTTNTNSNNNKNSNGANTINTIIKPCSVCQAPQAKYKCPQCRALYCSVACCRQHKQQQPEMCHQPQLSPAPLPALSKKKDEADDDNNNDEEEGQVLESADTVTTSGTTLLPSPSLSSRYSRYIPNFDTYLIQQHEPFWDRSMDDHDRNDGSSVTSVHVNRHHSTEAFERVDANIHDNHSHGQNNNNNNDDDDDDWKITADMKIAVHGSAWLRDELDRDPGLRYLIEQIATAPANRNDSVIRNHPYYYQKQERRGPFQQDKTATRTKATAPTMRQEELLDRMQCDFPQFQFFIDQLLVITGVLDRIGDNAQNTIPPSPPPPPLLRFTSKTTTATTKAHRSEYMEQQTTTQTTRTESIEASKIDQNEEEHSSRLFDLNSLDSTSRSSQE